jgi:hypothetical protein
MITRETLKREIDNVQDEYLIALYKIIKTFEHSTEPDNFKTEEGNRETKQEEWFKFLDKYAGCLADSPIERGDQGNFEQREKLI